MNLLAKIACCAVLLGAGHAWAQSSSTPIPAPKVTPQTKKGIGLQSNKPGYAAKVEALKVAWTYTWGADIPYDQPAGVEFVPMVWGLRYGEQQEMFYRRLKREFDEGKFTTLLGFNEPDGKDQANLPVEDALAAWPKLESVGARLGSPAGVHPDVPWMTEFMKQAKRDKLRVDFVTIHWYGSANQASEFIAYVTRIHRLYRKPVWITEFCPGDWGANPDRPNRNSPQQVAQFMRAVIPALKRMPYVERFAWFSADSDSHQLGTAALFHSDGSLTELGEIYAKY